MRIVVEWLLGALPFDPLGRRAIDETLADWSHDTGRPGSMSERAVRSLRSSVAVARVLLGLTARETMRIPLGWLVGRLLLILFLPWLVLASGTPTRWPGTNPLPWWGLSARLFFATQVSVIFLPVAFFYSLGWPPRNRSLPILGVAAFASILALTLGGWLLPSANQAYREAVFTASGGSGQLARGISELNLVQLVPPAIAGFPRSQATDALVTRTGLMVLCPSLVLLAAALGQLGRWPRRAWLVTTPVAFALVPILARLAGVTGDGRLDTRVGLGFWALSLLSLTLALRLNRAHSTALHPTSAR